MDLAPEDRRDIEALPAELRALLDAELAAGNAIAEVSHGFPAPPVGCAVNLARPVSTRPRASGAGIDFYDRNGSGYSGEFADARRFFFILEPPHPEPPPPDMDAIRDRHADVAKPAQTPAPSGPSLPPHAVLQRSTATDAAWLLHFRDARPPEAVQAALEGALMAPMPLSLEDGRLVGRAAAKVVGAGYAFVLTFEAALEPANAYSLRVQASWQAMPATHRDYYRQTSASWFELWTRGLQRAGPPAAGDGSAVRYRQRCDAALAAQAALGSVAAVQQAIVAAMQQGAGFATSHKEGGTHIRWHDGRFVRADHGESDEHQVFADEAGFLAFLRRFYDAQVSQHLYLGNPTELQAWTLILRLLRR